MNICVRIEQYDKHLNRDNNQLKHITEFLWRTDYKKARRCEYIFGVSKRSGFYALVSAYKISQSRIATDTDLKDCYEFDRNNKWDSAHLQTFCRWKGKRVGRVRFLTSDLSNEEQTKYIGQPIKYWGQYPVHYTNEKT